MVVVFFSGACLGLMHLIIGLDFLGGVGLLFNESGSGKTVAGDCIDASWVMFGSAIAKVVQFLKSKCFVLWNSNYHVYCVHDEAKKNQTGAGAFCLLMSHWKGDFFTYVKKIL